MVENYKSIYGFLRESINFARYMEIKYKLIFKIWRTLLCLLMADICFCSSLTAKDFTVVLDAGHGGHDAGAVGRISKEKNINLKVALAVGRLLKQNTSDIKVIYTRSTDKFIPLHGRADIANKAKADLFVSIHTNSLPKGKIARGTETYTLGLHRSKENLEVAKKENSVILIESDYKQRYAGFNPNSAESYIMFEFIQDKNMKQSVRLAQSIQKQFRTTARRNDRGVRQAGFLVLHATSMPSVLVELGYISTPDEERYLNSQEGIEALSKSICHAILDYKKQAYVFSDKKENAVALAEEVIGEDDKLMVEKTKSNSVGKSQLSQSGNKEVLQAKENYLAPKHVPVFKIQFLTSMDPLKMADKRLKGLKPVEYYKEGRIYKYTYGASTDYNKVYRTWKQQVLPKFKDAFIISFRGTEKINIQQAIKEFKQNRNK